jgi:lupus La protein
MRRFQPYSAIVAALRESQVLEVVDTENYSGSGNEAVKRKVPIKLIELAGDKNVTLEEHHDRLMKRSLNNLDASIYAKNFGTEEVGQIELENFFRPYGAVMVRKRRDKDDKWKGSVFVEFQDADAQKQFLSLEPPKFKDNQLVVMGKREYSKMKCEEKGITPAWELDPEAGQNTRNFNRERSGRGGNGRGGNRGNGRGRGRGRGRGGNHGGRDQRDRNSRREESNANAENGNKRKAESDDREETKKAKVEIKEDA